MKINIRTTSQVPIYEQIEQEFKAQILNGTLQSGDALPSIRMLAKDLKVSVITTKRAYEELERDGFVRTVAGKGTYIEDINLAKTHDIGYQKLDGIILELVEIKRTTGLTNTEILNYIGENMEGKHENT